MIRFLLAVICIGIGAGLGGPVAADPLAKVLFSAKETPSDQKSRALGGYAKGCLAGAVALPETGPTWQAMRLSRNRNWGHPELIDFIQTLSRKAVDIGWNGIYVGDLSQPRGGPMIGDHRSHQIGLDTDIWMLPPARLDLSLAERENISSISMRRAKGAYVNDKWTPQHQAILKAAAEDERVARIFVFPGAKVQMCKDAKGDRRWLRKIRPWWGHYAHFHVRLKCPKGSPGCVDQAPPPPGDGCEAAEEWVRDILNPPPPKPVDPNAPPPKPRREYVMADLPRQCTKVLSSE